MQGSDASRAIAAAMSIASSLGLTAGDAVVLHDSNKLTVRLLPCDVLARVAPVAHQVSRFEIELAQRLAGAGARWLPLSPGWSRASTSVTASWSRCGPTTSLRRPDVSPADYASALERLHAGMREVDIPAPHFMDRVEEAQRLVASRDHTPALAEADRELLGGTLRSLRRVISDRGAADQLLHGSRTRATCSPRGTGRCS